MIRGVPPHIKGRLGGVALDDLALTRGRLGGGKFLVDGNQPLPNPPLRLRRKGGSKLPLIVSPGHKVAMASAPELVMRYVTTYRLPEPTRLADRISSRRDR